MGKTKAHFHVDVRKKMRAVRGTKPERSLHDFQRAKNAPQLVK